MPISALTPCLTPGAGPWRAGTRSFEFFGGANAKPAEKERSKHVVTNTLVDADGDALVTTSYFQVLRSWGVANWGRYVDRFVADGDEWRIAHRSVHGRRQYRPATGARSIRRSNAT